MVCVMIYENIASAAVWEYRLMACWPGSIEGHGPSICVKSIMTRIWIPAGEDAPFCFLSPREELVDVVMKYWLVIN
jgi:hypothetical protein